MKQRSVAVLCAAFVLVALSVAGQSAVSQSGGSELANVAGEWATSMTTPAGPIEYTMYIAQEGPRLTGHLTSDTGELMLKGSVTGDQVKITWSMMERGKPLDIVVTGTAKGDSIAGTAKLGTLGEGPFSAERTGS
jgi:hypothetical protein